MIVFEGVHKRFGDSVVLSDLDLAVDPGEHVTLIGPSGSGKTTILRLLMCLERVDAGTIRVGGRYLSHMHRRGELVPADEKHSRDVRRRIGMVFQQFNLFPNMSVLGNLIEAPTRVLGLSRAEATERAAELLDMVGLAEKIDEHPARLSGGQQQRVAIARALAMRPDVLLLDEITSALDPELVAGVLRLLRRIGDTTDITILCVTHEIGFARDFSDRVLMLDGGRVIEDGPPDQLLREPRQPRTKEFLAAVLEGR
ncbi:ectoine/hydroxyectoine ABC transporter ATP-binding protein EhuA [Pseudonocardia humida]|uniref:Ectoine/hydroxyectoine ABC transporter ATP-binding protein EhuA n=1 Tax=Pseudonocardia humida TaxID=2800819 RepID=A0ABT0ZV99_9PSEU|nr:ectoine/hydroxyectoine ABC transporter ATP-binding protein EhuA [Pseudonocardia humida]MCO1654661.1 ectoine/hydroxyectoine ABC transporter ATP-binding protein EhuA [Pseudonocardia humida]